jgi:hypothetical protein
MNKDLIKKLAEQAGFTYTMRNAITTQQNGVPIESLEAFARLIVMECARFDSEYLNEDHVEGETYNWTLLGHFGVTP